MTTRVRYIMTYRSPSTINPSIYNIIRWFAVTPEQGGTYWPSVWCSKHYFFFIISYRIGALKTLYFHYRKIEKLIETIVEKDFASNCEKKIIMYLEYQRLGRWVPLVQCIQKYRQSAVFLSVLYWRLTDFITKYDIKSNTLKL